MMKAKILWIHLAGAGPYSLRPMDNERPGSLEMCRRVAVKEGYYRGTSRNDHDPAPSHYTQDELRYFHEGLTLGLSVPQDAKHPFGELSCNGGIPMLPFMGDELVDDGY